MKKLILITLLFSLSAFAGYNCSSHHYTISVSETNMSISDNNKQVLSNNCQYKDNGFNETYDCLFSDAQIKSARVEVDINGSALLIINQSKKEHLSCD